MKSKSKVDVLDDEAKILSSPLLSTSFSFILLAKSNPV
jgi:hypothetical protein